MKVLYVDISLSGHRYKYLDSLLQKEINQNFILVPQNDFDFKCQQFFMKSNYDKKRNLTNYISWINEINSIIKNNSIDLVHILCGDALYRFFGYKIEKIDITKVVTFHSMVFNKIRNFCFKQIFKKINYGIVHTEFIEKHLNKVGIYNVEQIEYPIFTKPIVIDSAKAKEKLGIPKDRISIVILGKATYYKGTDILLKALNYVDFPFYLYITRAEDDYNENFILARAKKYASFVKCSHGMLSDSDYALAMSSADLIVLPYRKSFGGTSGPMLEAVWNRKKIIGPDHGSMGNILKKYKLGYTFKSENVEDLVIVLNNAIANGLDFELEAENFRKKLTVENFVKHNYNLYSKAKGDKFEE